MTEHKHFTPWEQHDNTVYFTEFSKETGPDDSPFYPKRLTADKALLLQYRHLAAQQYAVSFLGRLATYRSHRNDEHLQALVEETLRYCGFCLENELSRSSFWGKKPLSRRVAVLLYLVDRGVVTRKLLNGRHVFIPSETAENWILAQPSLVPYSAPTLELLSALRHELSRRNLPKFS